MTAADPNNVELIPLSEVRRITGMGTTFIYGQIAANNFPKQRKVGERSSRWARHEVVAWANAHSNSKPAGALAIGPSLSPDRQLTRAEIEEMTGLGPDQYRAQLNLLTRQGIKCFLNARKQVIVWRSWIQLAAVNQVVIQIGADHKREEDEEEIVLDLSSLKARRNKSKK